MLRPSVHSHQDILSALTPPEVKRPTSKPYTPPHRVRCPFDFIILQNPAKHPNNFATQQLRKAWPVGEGLTLIQLVQEDARGLEEPPVGTIRVKVKDINNLTQIKAALDILASSNAAFAKARKEKKAALYSIWSAKAEDPDWAMAVELAGYVWIGANPYTMRGLEKTDFKKMALELGFPTAPFIEVAAKEKLEEMAQDMQRQHAESAALAGKDVFIKHNQGGGGRGSTKLAHSYVYENFLAALKKVVSETGGNHQGVYTELALDLVDHQLLQLELECDAGTLAEGGRLVWFGPEKQKVLEIGFNDEMMQELFLPKALYEACRAAALQIAQKSRYSSRGTIEILLSKNELNGEWSFNLLEFNKRIQVENRALADLVVDCDGRPRNTAAEQVLRSAGYSPPGPNDFRFSGPGIRVHMRLLLGQPSENGSGYLGGRIDGAFVPSEGEAIYAKGEIDTRCDPQIGAYLFSAETWPEVCHKMRTLQVQFHGRGVEDSTMNDFFRKLGANWAFSERRLGCNQTFEVLSDLEVPPPLAQKMVQDLATVATPLVTHGYRPGAENDVSTRSGPNRKEVEMYQASMASLASIPVPETPFSRFRQHGYYARYIQELKNQLSAHGGGTVTVFPRDVMQSQGDQESPLLQGPAARIAERHGAASGIFVGFETGGAQYQAGMMRDFDWLEVLCTIPENMMSHSLTRSAWMNGLLKKPLETQKLIFDVIRDTLEKRYGFEPGTLPFGMWQPYNFHAGNHPNQDITTRAMLQAGFAPIPCWAWDPRYTEDHFNDWVERQIKLFQVTMHFSGTDLSQIRIKNAGQGPEWSADVIVKMVNAIRKKFREAGFADPIIYIHNHEFDGAAASIGRDALRKCQQLDYNYLVVDSAPPLMSHNDNVVIADALKMTTEEREELRLYNLTTSRLAKMSCRFDSRELMYQEGMQKRSSEMAGGTGSSDLGHAKKAGIPPEKVPSCQAVAKAVIPLGTPVTPFSEFLKQIGFAIYLNNDIRPKPGDAPDEEVARAVKDYIEKGGTLDVSAEILKNLDPDQGGWETLLPCPPIVRKLLSNYPKPKEEAKAVAAPTKTDFELRAELKAKHPHIRWGKRQVVDVLAFDKIGEDALVRRYTPQRENERTRPRDMTLMMNSPDFVFAKKHAGDKFVMHGQQVTLTGQRKGAPGKMVVSYEVMGQVVQCHGVDPHHVAVSSQYRVKYVKDKNREIGANYECEVEKFLVKPGQLVRAGEDLVVILAMKMQHIIKAPKDLVVEELKPGKAAEKGEVLVTFRQPKPEELAALEEKATLRPSPLKA